MNGPTIAQIKAEAPESLWHFLTNLPFSMEAQLFYALLLAGTLGMVANYIVRWGRKEIEGCLGEYLFKQNLRGTVLSLATYVGVVLGAIAAGAFHVGDANTFVGWGWVLWMGAGNGFVIDNIANKGQKPVWTQQQHDDAGAK